MRADLLIRYTKDNPELRRELVALTSDAKETAGTVNRVIAGLLRSTSFYSYTQARKLVNKLDDLVVQIQKVAQSSPSNAFEMVCDLLATEHHVAQNVDDSDGGVGDVYRSNLPKVAASIARRYDDYEHMAKWLCVAVEKDPFGSRCSLIDALATIVPDSVMEALFAYVSERVTLEPPTDIYDSCEHAFILRRILVALGDTQRFIKVCTVNKEMFDGDILTLAQMFIEHEDFAKAELWLKKVGPDDNSSIRQARKLQLDVNKALGRTSDVKGHLREQFLSTPDSGSYQELAPYHTADELDALVAELVRRVAELVRRATALHDPPVPAIRFLIDIGKGAEMEQVVALISPTGFVNYYAWPAVAKSFEKAGLLFGAAVAYRILMDDILNHTRSNAYSHAARYYAQLWVLARSISDWRGIPDNEAYMAGIMKRHALKSSFWRAVEGSLKPPAVSRHK